MKRNWKEAVMFAAKITWRGYVIIALATLTLLPCFIRYSFQGQSVPETICLSIAAIGLAVLYFTSKDKNKFWNTLLWK